MSILSQEVCYALESGSVGGVLLGRGAVAGQGDGKGAKEIDGAWTFVSAVKGGKKKDFDGEPIRIVFKAGKMTIDKGGDTKNGSYKIDPAKKPKQIDFQREQTTAAIQAIYSLEGDRLIVCEPRIGAGRPSEFKAPMGSRVYLYTWKRVGP